MSYLYVSRGPNGYPVGMDIRRVWTWTQFFTHGYFHGWAKTIFMDMDMELILFNPVQTRPIAILSPTYQFA